MDFPWCDADDRACEKLSMRYRRDWGLKGKGGYGGGRVTILFM